MPAQNIAQTTPESFEAALAELETLVQHMEDSPASLDEMVSAYARGKFLQQFCAEQLDVAEQRVSVLGKQQLVPLAA